MSQHTPGPWTFDDDYYVVAGEENDIICELWSQDKDANARLIAAAPEMYEALKAINKAFPWNEQMTRPVFDKVHAAIAKAEGLE